MNKTPAWYYETRELATTAKSLLNDCRTLGTTTHYSTEELVECIRLSDLAPFFRFDDEKKKYESRPFRWAILDEMIQVSVGILSPENGTPLFILARPQSSCGRQYHINCRNTTILQLIAALRGLFEILDKKEKAQLALEDCISQVFRGQNLPFNLYPEKKGFTLSVRMPYKTKLTFHLKPVFTEEDITQIMYKAMEIKEVVSNLGRITLKGYGNNEIWIEPEQ